MDKLQHKLTKENWSGVVIATEGSLPDKLVRRVMELRLSGVRIYDLTDFYEDYGGLCTRDASREVWNCLLGKYRSEKYQLIRPSGNPIDSGSLIKMFTSADMKVRRIALVSVDSVLVLNGGYTAVAVYTYDQEFCFKGNENADRAVLSCVLEVQDGEIKIVHEHRTNGRPIPKESRWEADTSQREQ